MLKTVVQMHMGNLLILNKLLLVIRIELNMVTIMYLGIGKVVLGVVQEPLQDIGSGLIQNGMYGQRKQKKDQNRKKPRNHPELPLMVNIMVLNRK